MLRQHLTETQLQIEQLEELPQLARRERSC
jgi:ferritin-like metal-binding protein YciE